MKEALEIVMKVARESLKNPSKWSKKRIIQTIAEEIMARL